MGGASPCKTLVVGGGGGEAAGAGVTPWVLQAIPPVPCSQGRGGGLRRGARNSYPISDQNMCFQLPYFGPDLKFDTVRILDQTGLISFACDATSADSDCHRKPTNNGLFF